MSFMNPFKDRSMPLSDKWLDGLKKDLEESYLRYQEPWKQAGFLQSEEEWIECRRPIADCIDKSGAFLDISCSNGYLLECLMKWTAERGLTLEPFGIDLSEKLVAIAKNRLPRYSNNLEVANATRWTITHKFDYIRTELGYVLDDAQEQYLVKLATTFLNPDGKLLITEYRTKKQNVKEPWSTDKVINWDFNIVKTVSKVIDKKELLRLVVLTRKGVA
jgi:2-polyprenyl-3-methyl-5-hydroxy-6-metoxy-1,4-benzoquinol methylase